jgi:hypothetical protein
MPKTKKTKISKIKDLGYKSEIKFIKDSVVKLDENTGRFIYLAEEIVKGKKDAPKAKKELHNLKNNITNSYSKISQISNITESLINAFK